NNGTIFLDEIGEMDLNSQSKLLRVIQEKQVRRIGSNNVIDIDVRIIAATNRNLKELVSKNMFRRDLYFRLNVLPLKIHPLRERPADIFEIFGSLKYDIPCNFSLSEEVKEIFKMYRWEGNVRELRNLGEYFCYLGKDIIEICDLPEYILDTIDSNYSRT
ncbi:sigma 54-interacting transcriptional regulator, partial [Clostridioides difficile]